MYFVYLDEFGHIGPYVGRTNPKFNESPVFGLAGMILPEDAVRPFATYFLKQKEGIFQNEIELSGKISAKWEKKGTSFIRTKPLSTYVELRRTLHRVIKKIDGMGGSIFYYGREKRRGVHEGLNPTGLYTTCMSHALRKINRFCDQRNSSFVVVMDQHSARKELLECAAKTMFGKEPCTRLASPPFEVESYLNQNIQAADWIATLIGRLSAYDVCPDEFSDYEYIKTIFADKIQKIQKASILEKRPHKELLGSVSGPFAGLADLRAKLDAKL
jgi:hypothetical protein